MSAAQEQELKNHEEELILGVRNTLVGKNTNLPNSIFYKVLIFKPVAVLA